MMFSRRRGNGAALNEGYKMGKRYAIKLTSPAGKISYLTVGNRMSWTKARANFQANSASVLNHFTDYTIEVEEE